MEKHPMPRKRNHLNDFKLGPAVARAIDAGVAVDFKDGGGLICRVTDAGVARFVHRFPLAGGYPTMWLKGSYPAVSLKKAREWRDENEAFLAAGFDPRTARATGASPNPTLVEYARSRFLDLAPEYEHAGGCDASTWFRDISRRSAAIANMKIDEITGSDVERAIAPYWKGKRATPSGKRIAGVLARVFRSRHSAEHRDARYWQNPADFETLCDNLGSKVHVGKPRKALPPAEVPAYVRKLRLIPTMSARVLEWIIFTGCRAQEGAGAKWGEIDWLGLTWTIPASRLKTEQSKDEGEAFVVPLSLAAMRLLHRVRENRDGYDLGPNDFIFPSFGVYRCRGSVRRHTAANVRHAYGNPAIWKVCKSLNAAITVHGFRSSLVAWGTRIGDGDLGLFPLAVMDRCLGHMIGAKTAAEENDAKLSQALGSYLPVDPYLPQRTLAMRAWGAFIEGTPATPATVTPAASNVIELARAA